MRLARALLLIGLTTLAIAGAGMPGCVFYLNPQCNDLIHNGDETDVDCGGTCGKCDIGSRCRSNADCEDSTCESGTCTPLPCANGKKDQQETDVDCGGGTCRKCAGGRHCVAPTDCVTGMCVAATSTCFELATVSFADGVSYPSGNKTYVMFGGDINGDGNVDFVAGNELDSTVSVFLGSATGAFTRFGNPFPTGAYPTGGAIADFNGDGKPDVVTADYHGNSVSILLGSGTGQLGAPASSPTRAGAETSNLAVGDLNGDGKLDVVATNPQKHSVSEFLGTAAGGLSPAIDITVGVVGASEPFSAVIGDFDSNGANDLAVADNRTSTMIVLLGIGNGNFQPEATYPLNATGSFIVIATDLNLDNKLDLVTADRESSSITVLLGRGTGTFRKAIVVKTGDGPDGKGTKPYALAVADFNRDGVPDVVTANYQSSTATILLGKGDGTFEPAIDAGPTGTVSYGVVAADFNRDGKPDFAICNALSNDVVVKLSTSH